MPTVLGARLRPFSRDRIDRTERLTVPLRLNKPSG
jgi:hypothetical protein